MATTQTNPFADAFKAFTDSTAFSNINNISKFFPFDVNTLLSAQRRNAETVSAINQAIAESIQAVVRRQAEIFQAGATEVFDLVKEVSASPSPEATVAKQTAFAKSAFEAALSNTRELAEMVSKSNIEVFDLLGKRLAENIDEAANASGNTKKKAA